MPKKEKIMEYWNWDAIDYYIDDCGVQQRITRLEKTGRTQPQKFLFIWDKINGGE